MQETLDLTPIVNPFNNGGGEVDFSHLINGNSGLASRNLESALTLYLSILLSHVQLSIVYASVDIVRLLFTTFLDTEGFFILKALPKSYYPGGGE